MGMSGNNKNRILFVSCIVLMLLSLLMGAVSILYFWPMIYPLLFTFSFALFLVFGVYIYVSVRRQSVYEKLRHEKEEVEREAERKIEYFANMSHEIRTPINAIMGYNELILREYNDPALRQYANNIRSAANSLLAIVNDSLDYSRIEAGKMKLFPAEYDLGIMIEELVNMTRPRALTKGLELKCYVNENIPRVLYGDSDRIKQCVINILTNAVKYTVEGEIVLAVDFEKLLDESENGKEEILLKIAVRDTGIGIKEDNLMTLYKPFERIDEEKIKSVEGTGLGITIVKKILDLMGSKLEVESVYGEGSNFHFTIKQEVLSSDPIGDFEQLYTEKLVAQSAYRNRFIAPGVRILVVDDAEMNLSVMEGLLKNTRIHIDSALSAQTGLELAEKNKYDLIFIDLRMPGINGVQMCDILKGGNKAEDKKKTREVRNLIKDSKDTKSENDANEDSRLKNADTPCIALTAGALQEVNADYIKQGFADYLLKPIAYKELEMILMHYLPADKLLNVEEKNEDKPLFMTEGKLIEAMEVLERRSRT